MTTKLAWHDLQWCLRRAPKTLLAAMKKFGPDLIVAGGFIRACVTNEHINDIDCFCPSKDRAREIALYLVDSDEKRVHETDNAFTLRGFRLPIQIIHRWTFATPEAAILSFDFTIARSAFWWRETAAGYTCVETGIAVPPAGEWESICEERFYADLAGKRLIYCAPIRNEDAGGSLLRVLKFYQRGYRIPLDSLGEVIARLAMGVKWEDVEDKRDPLRTEMRLGQVLTGLLREVDPNIDPSHIAHLPAESARAQQSQEQEGAEDAT